MTVLRRAHFFDILGVFSVSVWHADSEKASRLQVPEAFRERLGTFGIRQVLKQVLCQQSINGARRKQPLPSMTRCHVEHLGIGGNPARHYHRTGSQDDIDGMDGLGFGSNGSKSDFMSERLQQSTREPSAQISCDRAP